VGLFELRIVERHQRRQHLFDPRVGGDQVGHHGFARGREADALRHHAVQFAQVAEQRRRRFGQRRSVLRPVCGRDLPQFRQAFLEAPLSRHEAVRNLAVPGFVPCRFQSRRQRHQTLGVLGDPHSAVHGGQRLAGDRGERRLDIAVAIDRHGGGHQGARQDRADGQQHPAPQSERKSGTSLPVR
jgi:hypothetical protein